MEHLKTPPNLTSSPKTTHLNNKKNHRKLNIYIYILMPFKYYFEIYFGSFSKAISKAWFIAVNKFIFSCFIDYGISAAVLKTGAFENYLRHCF
jgi:hypothetical protein